MANGVFCWGYTNVNGCYWEAKREGAGGVAPSLGKEGLFGDCVRILFSTIQF